MFGFSLTELSILAIIFMPFILIPPTLVLLLYYLKRDKSKLTCYECSECGDTISKNTKVCPSCGLTLTTCRICDKHINWFIRRFGDLGGLCIKCGRKCAIEEQNKSFENSIIRLGGSDIRCQSVIENVYIEIKSAYSNMELGDLFLTPNGLAYIRYASLRYYGNLSGLVGLLIGGPIGSIAGTMQDRNELSSARKIAESTRKSDNKMSLIERIRLHKARIIFKNDIKSLEEKNNIIHIVYTNGVLKTRAENDKSYQEKLEKWLNA